MPDGLTLFNDLANETLNEYSSGLAKIIERDNPTLYHLNRTNRKKEWVGGEEVEERIMAGENATVGTFAGYDPITYKPTEFTRVAKFPVCNVRGAVVYSFDEVRANRGDAKIRDLIDDKLSNLKISMENHIARMVVGGFSAKGIVGLQAMVADNPTTGTLAGISRTSTYKTTDGQTVNFWQNQYVTGVTSGNILAKMREAWRKASNGNDTPNLILAGENFYDHYESIHSKTYESNDKTPAYMADAGFTAIRFKKAEVVLDKNIDADHMYMLNSNWMKLRFDPDYQYKVMPPERVSGQMAWARDVLWVGQLTINNPMRFCVLTA